MNKVILIGNLTRDPECASTSTGTSYCRFTLAINRRNKDPDGKQLTDFIPVVAWRKLADLCGQYLSKGSKAGVTGELQTRTYLARDGSKRYATEVIADTIEFLSRDKALDGFEEIEDEELPF